MKELTFEQELTSIINRYSKENASNTPDFMLARYLSACLENYNVITKARDSWFNINMFKRATVYYPEEDRYEVIDIEENIIGGNYIEEDIADYLDVLNPVTIPLEDTDALKEALGITDTQRLDKLDRLTKGYRLGWILRESISGRGMRLHESGKEGAVKTVREAIDNFEENIN